MHTDLRPVSVYVNQAGKIMTVASGLDFVTHVVTNAMDQPTLIVSPVSPTLKTQKLLAIYVYVMMTGADQIALTTRVNVEKCVTDVMDQEMVTVSTVSNTPIRTIKEFANVTLYGTLNGVTFHTRPATFLVEPVTELLTQTSVSLASEDSTLELTDTVIIATITAQPAHLHLMKHALNATMDGIYLPESA